MRIFKRVNAVSEAKWTERTQYSQDPFEIHYTLRQIADWWGVDPETVRRRFINEEGVLILAKPGKMHNRRSYLTLRIPESVLRRVYERETKRTAEPRPTLRPDQDKLSKECTLSDETPKASGSNPSASTDRFDQISLTAEAFLDSCRTNGVKPPTIRKYRNTLTKLIRFAKIDEICKSKKVQRVSDLTVTDLDRFRAGRRIARITALKELQTLRQFWHFLQCRDLCSKNIALLIQPPIILDQNSVVPYRQEEIRAIIDACSRFGRNEYERKRARAIVLTLCHTALRISDIALLSRDRVARVETGWRIFLRTTKNNAAVYLPIPKVMFEALSDVPPPRGSDQNCPCYFWNQRSTPKSVISVVSETLSAVFRASGVRNAKAHRFRHSLATQLLGAGGTFEEVADVLGNSVPVIRKHYAKWSTQRQARVDHLLHTVHGQAWIKGA